MEPNSASVMVKISSWNMADMIRKSQIDVSRSKKEKGKH